MKISSGTYSSLVFGLLYGAILVGVIGLFVYLAFLIPIPSPTKGERIAVLEYQLAALEAERNCE